MNGDKSKPQPNFINNEQGKVSEHYVVEVTTTMHVMFVNYMKIYVILSLIAGIGLIIITNLQHIIRLLQMV